MREYKFRGKRVDNGEWVYGGHCKIDGISLNAKLGIRHYIVPEIAYIYLDSENERFIAGIVQVHPETVGQFTDQFDKNDVDIYEGHILTAGDGVEYIVHWNRGEFMTSRVTAIPKRLIQPIKKHAPLTHWNLLRFEVIGNIHENPELLEETK